jgi:predicted dehydrogenase
VIPSLHVIRIGANVKRWNFAIVGAGNIGKVHAQAINSLDNARVSVVCDVNQESARALVKSSDATFTHDYRRVIENPNVDVVCVCTPSGSHAEIAVAAAEVGKHLVIEKPIDITLERVD